MSYDETIRRSKIWKFGNFPKSIENVDTVYFFSVFSFAIYETSLFYIRSIQKLSENILYLNHRRFVHYIRLKSVHIRIIILLPRVGTLPILNLFISSRKMLVFVHTMASIDLYRSHVRFR